MAHDTRQALSVVCPVDAAPGDTVRAVSADGATSFDVLPGDTFTPTLQPFDEEDPTAFTPPPPFADCGAGAELEPRDPISDAPGGLQALGAEIAGERAIVASFFEATAVEVSGGEVLERALRAVLRAISDLDALDELIDAHAATFAEWDAAREQQLGWTATFDEYVRLVEVGVSEALDDLECSADELFDYARAHHVESAAAQRLLTRLLAMADYAEFGRMMREAHERGPMGC